MIDVAGRVVVPGFNDAHWHIGADIAQTMIDFGSLDPSLETVEDSIRAVLARADDAFIGGRIGPTLLDDPAPVRRMLDELAHPSPIRLYGWAGHSAIYNAEALRRADAPDDVSAVSGGRFQRSGDTIVALHGYAWFTDLKRTGTSRPDTASIAAIRRAGLEAVSLGITTLQAIGLPLDADHAPRLVREANVPVRIRLIRFPSPVPDARSYEPEDRDGGMLYQSGMKWIVDGTPIERNARMTLPWADRPRRRMWYMSIGEIRMAAGRALGRDAQPLFHAVGDSAISTVLSALIETAPDTTWRRLRPRIEHADFLREDQLPALRRLGVIVVQNPSHLMLGDLLVERVGPERAARAQLLASLARSGIPLALGSDGPLNPFLNILFATTHPGNPAEALTREEAVIAYTAFGAYAEGISDKGMIAVGMLADIAVLSQDIFTVPAQALPGTVSVLTIVDGRVVHETN